MSTNNNIKLYGFGVVGQGFQTYLANNENAKRLHTIIVKDERKKRKNVPSIIECTNNKTIRDKNVDVILELINSSEEAYGIVAENLEIGKKVISANKKLIAENLADLIKIEKSNNGNFLYEGAVCGSIPIIRILNDFFANDEVLSVSGIFNGSSNYILSKIFNEGLSYDEALKDAQELGFAESDPTSDVGGFDALYKLIIITAHAFGLIIKPDQVLNIGIESISKSDIEFAKDHNLKIKLIAKVQLVNNKIKLTVLPTLINQTNDLYAVENEYNGVVIESKNIGKQFYKGKGAGSLPTGSVVYSDLKAIDAGYSYSYKKLKENNFKFSNQSKITVVLSSKFGLNLSDFDFIKYYPVDYENNQVIAELTLDELKRNKLNFQKQGITVLAIDEDSILNKIAESSLNHELILS